MLNETVDDILEKIADQAGIYGGCPAHENGGECPKHGCRCCWISEKKAQLIKALENDRLDNLMWLKWIEREEHSAL